MTNQIPAGADKVADFKPKKYVGSIYSSVDELPDDFVEGIQQIEKELQMPVWMVIQKDSQSPNEINLLDHELYKYIFHHRTQISENQPVALLIDSHGGIPKYTYQLAKFFIHRCGEYIALVPSFAKSAGTLLTLGATKIILGTYAELGPIDLQINDSDSEEMVSALNHVQSLEQLRTFALETLDTTTYMLLTRTRKKVSAVLPEAIKFTTAMIEPLFHNLDVVRYTEMSRNLKIGEDYAVRLLKPRYGEDKAKHIAKKLVSSYPEHGFVIDHEELSEIGLEVERPSGDIEDAFTNILPYMDNLTVIGKLQHKDAK